MIKFCEPLKNKTTFKIGGPAQVFCEPKGLEDLKSLVAMAKKEGLCVLVLGAGSNILVDDSGVNAFVLRLKSPFFRKISIKGRFLQAGSGVKLTELLRAAKNKGLGGLEFLAGIPGTVGGALAMNAGACDSSIGQFVDRVSVFENNRVVVLKKNDIRFRYRSSGLSKFIILSARFRLLPRQKSEIDARMKGCLAKRRTTQDYSYPNAGCVFKNPQRDSAGRLIDMCGLKGRSLGGALISKKHANFILNKADASSSDIVKIMDMVKKEVHKKFKVSLKPEIKVWK
ncbi:MAG: UDP-N-acetylmuramate dehydrogenase [Candidatus Omnitrophica bacterium]|nr:UDP-N-acetylmuramate dehydrogenase [Candidatus Omnitrophota bacterium]